MCAAEGRGGGRRRRRRRVSHCYWCVLYCLSKYSGSFILSLREPSPLNINIMPLKARIMWGNWDYLPIRRLAELLFACLEETLPKDSYCIREKMGNICLRNFIKRMEGLFIFLRLLFKIQIVVKRNLSSVLVNLLNCWRETLFSSNLMSIRNPDRDQGFGTVGYSHFRFIWNNSSRVVNKNDAPIISDVRLFIGTISVWLKGKGKHYSHDKAALF